MSNKNEKTSDEAKVQQDVVADIPAVFNVDEREETVEVAEEVIEETVEADPAEKESEQTEKEADDEVVSIERKVVGLVVVGNNLHAVKHILKDYKWNDGLCGKMYSACMELEAKRKHISSASIAKALGSEIDLQPVLSSIASPNFLIPFANRLVSLQNSK